MSPNEKIANGHHHEEGENIVRSTLPPVKYANCSVGEYFVSRFSQFEPDSIAFLDPDRDFLPISYGSLYGEIHAFASALLRTGLTASDFFTYFSDNCHQYSVTWLAASYLGLSLCSIPPSHGPFEVAHQLRETRATMLIVAGNKMPVMQKVLASDEYRGAMSGLKVIVQLNSERPDDCLASSGSKVFSYQQLIENAANGKLMQVPHFPVQDPETKHFAIFFTSGTTGKPKGVIYTHHSYIAELTNTQLGEEYRGQSTVLPYPLGHISGSYFMPLALCGGMTVLFINNSYSIDSIMALIDKLRINQYIFSVNAAAPLAHNDYHLKYDLSCLKEFRYGGAKIAANLLEAMHSKYRVRMVEVYGATECMGSVGNRLGGEFKPNCLGQVLANCELKIADLDKPDKNLPANCKGEICLRGPPCFVGYLNAPEETHSAIDSDGWYHSGDVGYYDEHHRLYLTDRIKEVIKYKFYTVFPAETEEFIIRHEAVAAVCVVGEPHKADGYWARAYVQLKPNCTLTEQQLMNWVQENIAEYKWLHGGARFVQEMPRTLVGKVDRQYFKRLVKEELLTEVGI